MYRAKFAVLSEIRTKYATQSEHHLDYLNAEPGDT